MKKLFLSLLFALCTAFALFGLAACDGNGSPTTGGNQDDGIVGIKPQSYTVTVDCGEGGSYKLSHESPVAANTQVTLTVTTQTGYALSSVKKNGEAVTLVNGRHVFTPSEDTSFVITFDKLYTVTVDCGANGSYELTPQNALYRNGTQATLTLHPDSGYGVRSFTVNGADKKSELQGNVYAFSVTENVSIAVTFKALVNVTVSCGSGGEYELSPTGGIYSAGTSVTIALKPDTGYEVKTFTVDGVDKKGELQENAYTFEVNKNTAVVVSFYNPADENALDIMVSCGSGGTFDLSPKAPYHAGDKVTLTVIPNNGFGIQSVTVDGTDVTAQLDEENKYVITVNADVDVAIVFKGNLFPENYVGTWTSVVASGTLPDELVITADTLTFNGTVFPVIKTATGYAFTVTEDAENIYRYSFTLESAGEGKYLLILTVQMPDGSATNEVCTKEGVSYASDFPEALWGDWDAGPSNYPIRISETELTVGGDKAVVQSYNETTKTYTLLAGGTQYTLIWNETDGTLTLTIVGDAASAVVYTKAIPPEEAFFTQFAGYFYTNGEHNVQIGADGSFTFDGTKYSALPVDSSNPTFGYTFRKNGELWHIIKANEKEFLINDANYSAEIVCKRVTGDEAYKIRVNCVGKGTYELSKPKNGGETYGAYELVSITVSAAAGYRLSKLTVNGANVTDSVVDNVYRFYIPFDTEIEIEFVAESELRIFPNYYYQYTFSGKTDTGETATLVFQNGKIKLTVNGTEYVASEADVTKTDANNFTVAFKELGDVAFTYVPSGIAGGFRFSCDTFSGTMMDRTRVS